MSPCPHVPASPYKPLPSRLSLCIFVASEPIAQSLTAVLDRDRYRHDLVQSPAELLSFIEEHKEQIDCLIVLEDYSVFPLFNQLYEKGTLLPVILLEQQPESTTSRESATYFYHSAEIRLSTTNLEAIAKAIDQAITQFLYLAPNCTLPGDVITLPQPHKGESQQSFLMLQQRRLSEKLQERLGYLGVYYKRNPQNFYRNLSQEEKQELSEQLSSEYREIILNYFSPEVPINSAIDQFVNLAFFADISVSRILEIHMELIDEFSQQLKLEGRSEEILLDYRLALIDILAHIGEMYRRSIPREDIPFELLYRID